MALSGRKKIKHITHQNTALTPYLKKNKIKINRFTKKVNVEKKKLSTNQKYN